MGDRQWRREERSIERHLRAGQGEVVLDIPFGTGRFAPIYLKRGVEVVGIDISPDMLAEASRDPVVQQLAPSLVEGDVENLPLAEGSVDYVVSTRLLNWLPAPVREAAIGEFGRVARLGILVQVRVCERYSRAGFLRRLARSGSVNGRDVARAFANPVRSRSQTQEEESAPGPDLGYTTPDATDFERLLAAHGFRIGAKERVHEDVHLGERTIYCKTLFVCTKRENVSAPEPEPRGLGVRE